MALNLNKSAQRQILSGSFNLHVISYSTHSAIVIHSTKADQNTVGALLESPTRTAMHGKSRVSSAVSVELNCLP